MYANESQKPENNDDLQKLWQQSIHNDSIKLKAGQMILDIKKEVQRIEYIFPSGKWSVDLVLIFMAVRGTVRLFNGIEIGDTNKIIFAVADMIFWSLLAVRQIIVDINTSRFNENNERGYCRKQLERIRLQIMYIRYLSPFLTTILTLALLLSMWLDFRVWWALFYCCCIGLGVYMEILNQSLVKEKLLPLRNKLESALQQLNEKA
ncbi:MAG: hypothetical protein MUF71_04400 [Candidatus Kapabacteria bacterium]|jgi:hypothetical protein|nr:hypothetical protein [Candidatus Kapabacteria bacterium]